MTDIHRPWGIDPRVSVPIPASEAPERLEVFLVPQAG